MSSHSASVEDGGEGRSSRAHIHLLMPESRNRQLLSQRLDGQYEHSTSGPDSDPQVDPDLWILDRQGLAAQGDALAERREAIEPLFEPVLLIADPDCPREAYADLLQRVDDIVEAPVREATLEARIENLLNQRRLSMRLARANDALQESITDLRVMEEAFEAAPKGVTITDPTREDNPLVFVNDAFERITGYTEEDVLGRNPRFLQGPSTDPAAVRRLADAVSNGRPVSETLVNYRADGRRFWNDVVVSPAKASDGAITHFVGFQTDVTRAITRQQRLSVLNRILRHNLCNDLNVILGHADNLEGPLSGTKQSEDVEAISRAAEKLLDTGMDARRIDRILGRESRGDQPTDLEAAIATVRDRVGDRPVEFREEIAPGEWTVRGDGIVPALMELVDNAIDHTGDGRSTVMITVGAASGSSDLVELCVVDDGAGIPDGAVDVLRKRSETQLEHNVGLGLWLVHWVVTRIGGEVEFGSLDGTGTVVRLTLPRYAEND